ncbi:hypothetical protein OV079_49010 [Nannocystis pusilla]|uniref:NHL repeat containing protein n=1 Tax=Nannocystis pusilla TaxID=889268 RepID=A0A9X3EZS9_9BACT|nr:hypothetical protein [Nannocystis pusilla]MCY1013342.1 hypothetical protein [Nannocystis pusilla]
MSTAAAPRFYCDAAEHFIGTRATEADPVYAGSRGAPGRIDGPRRKARFHGPRALTEGGASLLFVADTGNGAVRSIDTRAGVVNTALTLADICTIAHVQEFTPSGLACDGEWLVIADTRNHVVWSYDLRSHRLALLAGCPGTPETSTATASRRASGCRSPSRWRTTAVASSSARPAGGGTSIAAATCELSVAEARAWQRRCARACAATRPGLTRRAAA